MIIYMQMILTTLEIMYLKNKEHKITCFWNWQLIFPLGWHLEYKRLQYPSPPWALKNKNVKWHPTHCLDFTLKEREAQQGDLHAARKPIRTWTRCLTWGCVCTSRVHSIPLQIDISKRHWAQKLAVREVTASGIWRCDSLTCQRERRQRCVLATEDCRDENRKKMAVQRQSED